MPAKIKVLFVDDSKTVRLSAIKLLESICDVRVAEDGFDAFVKLSDEKADIIFMDIMMPKMDGYQACALIKHNEEYKDIPVILVSSNGSVLDKAKGRIVGSEDYITKPFSVEDLIRSMKMFTKIDRKGELEWNMKENRKKA